MGFAMQGHLSIKSAAKNTKYDDITLFYNWLRKIISMTGNANAIIMILRSLLLSNQETLAKLTFADENTKQTVQHVTVRMDISNSKDGKHVLSEFFHAHNGNINIDFRTSGGLRYVVTGNMDILTNAWVADPGSPIIVNGPVFSQPGKYNIILEVTTIDNDKTDLPQPLKYELNVPVS
jgi:hypothetical protein